MPTAVRPMRALLMAIVLLLPGCATGGGERVVNPEAVAAVFELAKPRLEEELAKLDLEVSASTAAEVRQMAIVVEPLVRSLVPERYALYVDFTFWLVGAVFGGELKETITPIAPP